MSDKHWRGHFHGVRGTQLLAKNITLIEEHDFLDEHSFETALPRLSKIERPVLWCCTNPVDVAAVRARADQVWGAGGYFVMHWDALAPTTDTQAAWPCFLIEQRVNARQLVATRQHRISMLAGRVRQHRIELWCAMKDLVQQDDVVVINQFGLERCGFDHAALGDLPWANRAEFIDEDQSRPVCTNTASIQHPAFRACVNIPAETLGAEPGMFITEKTWKAIAAGCMVWHSGCQNSAEYLANLGFHDWFGPNPGSVRELFARSDLWDFYQDNLQGIEQDLELFWSQALVQSLTAPAMAALESWLSR